MRDATLRRGPAGRRRDRARRAADQRGRHLRPLPGGRGRSTRWCSTRPRPSGSPPRSRRSPRGCRDRQSLQLYVQARRSHSRSCWPTRPTAASRPPAQREDGGEHERATAIRRLGIAQEQSIRTSAQTVAPLPLRYLVVCPVAARGPLAADRAAAAAGAARQGRSP